jgi:hypothetical protein
MRTGAQGRRPALEDDDWMTAAATAVLQHRLDDVAHPAAVARVCASHALTRAEVERSWSRRRRDALALLTVGRVVDACPWNDDELARLARIFPDRA